MINNHVSKFPFDHQCRKEIIVNETTSMSPPILPLQTWALPKNQALCSDQVTPLLMSSNQTIHSLTNLETMKTSLVILLTLAVFAQGIRVSPGLRCQIDAGKCIYLHY